MKKIFILILLICVFQQCNAQDGRVNVLTGLYGENLGLGIMLEIDLLKEESSSLYLRTGASWLFFGYGIPHGVSICKGDKNQIEFGVSGIYSSTKEFFGSRIAKEYHISPVLGYRGYVKSKKAFFRFYLTPMFNMSKLPLSYGLFNGEKAVFMAGVSVGFKLK